MWKWGIGVMSVGVVIGIVGAIIWIASSFSMIGDVAKRPGTAGEPTTVELDAGDRLSIWPTSPAPDVRTPTNSSGSPDAGDACVVFVVGLVVLVIGLGRRQPPAPRYL